MTFNIHKSSGRKCAMGQTGYFIDSAERPPAIDDFKAKAFILHEDEGGGSVVSAVVQGDTEDEAMGRAEDMAIGANMMALAKARIVELDGLIHGMARNMAESYSRTAERVKKAWGEEYLPEVDDIEARTYAILEILRNERIKLNNMERMLNKYHERRMMLLELLSNAAGGEGGTEGEEDDDF